MTPGRPPAAAANGPREPVLGRAAQLIVTGRLEAGAAVSPTGDLAVATDPVATETLVSLVESQPPGLLALSATGTARLEKVRRVVGAVRRSTKGRVSIAVGGQLFASRSDLPPDLDVDVWASNPEELVTEARRLLDGPGAGGQS